MTVCSFYLYYIVMYVLIRTSYELISALSSGASHIALHTSYKPDNITNMIIKFENI